LLSAKIQFYIGKIGYFEAEDRPDDNTVSTQKRVQETFTRVVPVQSLLESAGYQSRQEVFHLELSTSIYYDLWRTFFLLRNHDFESDLEKYYQEFAFRSELGYLGKIIFLDKFSEILEPLCERLGLTEFLGLFQENRAQFNQPQPKSFMIDVSCYLIENKDFIVEYAENILCKPHIGVSDSELLNLVRLLFIYHFFKIEEKVRPLVEDLQEKMQVDSALKKKISAALFLCGIDLASVLPVNHVSFLLKTYEHYTKNLNLFDIDKNNEAVKVVQHNLICLRRLHARLNPSSSTSPTEDRTYTDIAVGNWERDKDISSIVESVSGDLNNNHIPTAGLNLKKIVKTLLKSQEEVGNVTRGRILHFFFEGNLLCPCLKKAAQFHRAISVDAEIYAYHLAIVVHHKHKKAADFSEETLLKIKKALIRVVEKEDDALSYFILGYSLWLLGEKHYSDAAKFLQFAVEKQLAKNLDYVIAQELLFLLYNHKDVSSAQLNEQFLKRIEDRSNDLNNHLYPQLSEVPESTFDPVSRIPSLKTAMHSPANERNLYDTPRSDKDKKDHLLNRLKYILDGRYLWTLTHKKDETKFKFLLTFTEGSQLTQLVVQDLFMEIWIELKKLWPLKLVVNPYKSGTLTVAGASAIPEENQAVIASICTMLNEVGFNNYPVKIPEFVPAKPIESPQKPLVEAQTTDRSPIIVNNYNHYHANSISVHSATATASGAGRAITGDHNTQSDKNSVTNLGSHNDTMLASTSGAVDHTANIDPALILTAFGAERAITPAYNKPSDNPAAENVGSGHDTTLSTAMSVVEVKDELEAAQAANTTGEVKKPSAAKEGMFKKRQANRKSPVSSQESSTTTQQSGSSRTGHLLSKCTLL